MGTSFSPFWLVLAAVAAFALLLPMSAWRGVLDRPAYFDPLQHGVLVSLGYIVVATAIGFVVFRRRDVTAG